MQDQMGIGISQAYGIPQEQVINGVNNAWEFTTTVYSFIFEPVDWITGACSCVSGECSPWMLAGFLPFIPITVARHVDDSDALLRNAGDLGDDATQLILQGFYKKAFHNRSANAALIGKYIPGSSASYEKIAAANGLAHLDLKEPIYAYLKRLYGQNADKIWWKYINLPFIEEIAESRKVLYLSTDPKTLSTTSDTFREIAELAKRGYSQPVLDPKTGLWIMYPK